MHLELLAPLDSPAMAEKCRRDLDMPRHIAAELGESALSASRVGVYRNSDGNEIVIRELVSHAVAARLSIPPDQPLAPCGLPVHSVTSVQISNETTIAAAQRLGNQGLRPLALNFANGISPGGGFLHGARAQEECLCRSSALYLTLEGDPMYDYHRSRPISDSSDWCIVSPDVPFFRHDDGSPLDRPWTMDLITCAAPYAPTVGRERSRRLLKSRIHRVLTIARSRGSDALLLGAWGCGAFGNDPRDTALDFREAIEGEFLGSFAHIAFAITDWSPERRFLGPFQDVFAKAISTMTSEPHSLDRFLTAQQDTYVAALQELRAGWKQGHWMWFIFPQIDGLGHSSTARFYAIKSLEEAAAYLAHPVLGSRLIECCEALLLHPDRSARDILGSPDDLKLRSCATLFAQIRPENPAFSRILDTFYPAGPDHRTIELLGLNG
jgi:uncharacterized protein (TIGR02452 family)